jgi:iron complex transport system permease protein
MKINLDLTKLYNEGKINQQEYSKLLLLSTPIEKKGSALINIIGAFGVLAVVGSLAILITNLLIGIILSLLVSIIGILIVYKYKLQWGLLGNILLIIGAIGTAICAINYFDNNILVYLFISVLFLIISLISESGLLISLAAISISPLIKAEAYYGHASYTLVITQPIISILVFSLLSIGSYIVSKSISSTYERLLVIFSRTCLFMVNFSFMVGSLWGDQLGDLKIADFYIGILWAVGLLLTGVWASYREKKFVLNTVATFGMIHFYTQWFERLGAQPIALLVAGLMTIFVAIGLWKYNKS